MKKALLILSLILLPILSISQDKDSYDRVGVSILHTNYQDNFDNSINSYYSSYKTGNRYDFNKIKSNIILVNNSNRTFSTKDKEGKIQYHLRYLNEEIESYLNEKNIGLEVISTIFNRKDNGKMDLSIIQNRGEYNATDQDYLQSVSSKRGYDAIKEMGEKLLNNNYFMVFDNINLRYLFTKDFGEEKGEYYYIGSTIMYLLKIEWSEELLLQIWDCWIDDETPKDEIAKRIETFKKIRIPVKLVGRSFVEEHHESSHIIAKRNNNILYKDISEAQLEVDAFNKYMAHGISTCIYNMEGKVEKLALRTSVYDVKPIRAKIGTKEGLRTDNTFYTYNYTANSKGETVKKRAGVIRAAKKISNNSRITTGNFEPSEFYQLAGSSVEKGQSIVEKKMAAISVEVGGVGMMKSNLNFGFNFGIEYDAYAGKNTQWYLSLNGNILSTHMNYGVNAGWGFRMNNFQIYPRIGVYMDMLTQSGLSEESKKSASAWIGQAGIKANINIYFPFQVYIFGGYNIGFAQGVTHKSYLGDEAFGLILNLGVRYCF